MILAIWQNQIRESMPKPRAIYRGIYKEIGRRLREAREAVGLSQAEMGALLDMSDAYGRYETAERNIPLDQLKRAAELLGKPVSYFLGEQLTPDDVLAYEIRTLSKENQEYIRKTIKVLKEEQRRATVAESRQ